MPELPEVETVRRGLSRLISDDAELVGLKRSPQKLRFRFPARLVERLQGQRLRSLERRAKYLLFQFERHTLLQHLGMTGSWRVRPSVGQSLELHEHVALSLEGMPALVYHDPRRFGYFDLIEREQLAGCRWLHHLGPEPLVAADFNTQYLYDISRGRGGGSVKTFLMDQKTVVGVGNIYASEALFLAGISPERPPGRLSRRECEVLVESIRQVLTQAIEKGGTTIRDFVSTGGELGSYAGSLLVYGRNGLPCGRCGAKIETQRQAGRATYSCPKCQR